jgi:hypothetical protein
LNAWICCCEIDFIVFPRIWLLYLMGENNSIIDYGNQLNQRASTTAAAVKMIRSRLLAGKLSIF